MRDIKKKEGSLVKLLVQNYMVFTMIIVVSGILIFTAAGWVVNRAFFPMDTVDIGKYQKELKSGAYEQIPLSRMGDGFRWFEILDENAKQVYSSGGQTEPYTKEELECIPLIEEEDSVYVEEFQTEDEKKITLVTKVALPDSGGQVSHYVLLDDQKNVISETWGLNRKKLTEREYALLTQETSGNQIGKYPFETEQNKTYTLILYNKQLSDYQKEKMLRANDYGVLLFLLIYIVLVIAFVFWMNRKIKKPLRILDDALVKLANEEETQSIEYQGPREFMQICDNFNRLNQKLEQSETRRSQLEQEKQKMLADISHDLKTPVTVIQGYARAISDGLVTGEKKERYLETIYSKSCTLNDLINTFHDYSRLEHPDFKLVREELNFSEYCREYIAGKYNEFELDGYGLEVDIPDEKITVLLDRMQFRRVFDNILGNFVKHNQRGTTCYFTVQNLEEWVEIMIADNGTGIPEEIGEKIFQPFTVGEQSRTSGKGSGLGLAIAKRIVEEHGGNIRFVYPPGEPFQTEFRIRLRHSSVEK